MENAPDPLELLVCVSEKRAIQHQGMLQVLGEAYYCDTCMGDLLAKGFARTNPVLSIRMST